MTDFDGAAVDALRDVLARRQVKITDLAEQTGIPYRSLQNYLYKRSRMPLDVYVTVCAVLDITLDYIFDQKFKLKHSALQDAIATHLSPILDRLHFDDDLVLSIRPEKSNDSTHARHISSTLAVLIAQAYDVEREIASLRPFESGE